MIKAISFYRLGQLMQEFLPHVLVNHAFSLHMMVDLDSMPRLVEVEYQPGQPVKVPSLNTQPVPANVRESFKPCIQALREEIIKLRFKASWETVEWIKQNLERDDYQVHAIAKDADELHGRLRAELKHTTCFALADADEQRYTKPNQFGEVVAKRFSEMAYDIDEATKCLTLSRGTACVLHLMRVLEKGLQELGSDLKLLRIDKNWENLLNDVDAAIKALPFKTDTEKEYRSYRAEAAAHLRNVKNAWRNKIVHPGEKYTIEEAEMVWTHTKFFIQNLATFL